MATNKDLRVAGKCQQAQEKFRIMIFRLSTRLGNSECESIHYLAGLPTPERCTAASEGFPLHVLSSLEANGRISPWNVNFLEFLLTEIHHEELLPIVRSYKDSKEFKNALKERKKKDKRRNISEGDSETCACPSELAAGGLGKTLDRKRRLRALYALLITHVTGLTQVMEILRDELDKIGEEGVDSAMDRFLQVAEDGEHFTDDLRKVFRDMGIKSNRSSASSEGTPAPITPDGDTDIMRHLEVSSRLVVPQSPHELPTVPARLPRKRPVPLPRTKYTKATPSQASNDLEIYENPSPIKQEEGDDVSLEEYRRYLQSISAAVTPQPLMGEEEEDDTTENTGDSGISEWTSGHRAHSECNLLGSSTPEKDGYAGTLHLDRAHSVGDMLDSTPCANERPVYTALLRTKDPVSEYASVSYGDNIQRS